MSLSDWACGQTQRIKVQFCIPDKQLNKLIWNTSAGKMREEFLKTLKLKAKFKSKSAAAAKDDDKDNEDVFVFCFSNS